jgi:hypothetical protein
LRFSMVSRISRSASSRIDCLDISAPSSPSWTVYPAQMTVCAS